MVWRMRVLGEFGRNAHPAGQNSFLNGAGDPPTDAKEYPNSNSTAVCVAHPAFVEAPVGSSLCKDTKVTIPDIPPVPVIAPMNAFNFQIQAAVQNLRNLFQAACSDQGQINWYFTATLFSGYKRAVAIRKQMIEQIAANMSGDASDFKDQKLASVRTGVLNTLKNNLTHANLLGMASDNDVQTLNSMALGPCANVSHWLPDVPIRPYFMYTDNAFASGVGCKAAPQPIFFLPTSSTIMQKLDPDGQLRDLALNGDSVDNSNPMHSSLGFEKNPWCVTYFGVRAKTKPRKPFAPFGPNVTLEARSFAAPFGGRVGPWYGSVWQRGDGQSSGDRTDPLTPPRLPLAAPIPPDEMTAQSMPNYSRYPGDPLGMKSMAALAASRDSLWKTFQTGGEKIALAWYEGIKNLPATGDALPWDDANNKAPWIRNLELAAIEPDLFDITYYSIDPHYPALYFGSSQTGRFQNLKPISDLGTRFTPDAMMNNDVGNQIALANVTTNRLIDPTLSFWTIRSPAHLLTGWTQKSASNYGFPSEAFGQCNPNGSPKPDAPTTGGCAIGGRVGYSIRHVAREYLLMPSHENAGSSGPFENPPSLAGPAW